VDTNNDGVCEDYDGVPGITDEDLVIRTETISPGGTKHKGFTIDLTWIVTAKDRLSAIVSYEHNKYKTYNTGAAILALFPNAQDVDVTEDDFSGRKFGRAPWRANASYTHTFNIGDTGILDITGDLYYEGQALDSILRMNQADEYVMPGRDAYWLGDISARYSSSYGMPSGMLWHVRAWCNNVWDSTEFSVVEHFDEFRNPATGQYDYYGPQRGYMVGNYVFPREFGIAFGANW
jgi:hypothetical protein